MNIRMLPGLRYVLLGALCVLAACQPQALPEPVPVQGVGYLIFNAAINPVTRDLFISDIDKFRNAGATEIRIGMNSAGGDIDAAQAMVDYMGRLHSENGITFKTYNIGVVASAATFVFLNAQDRYSAARAAFLFHAAAAVSSGPVNAETLRDEADKLDAYERTVRATLRARTKLTDAEAQTYVRRTVILNPDDARRDGVIDGIAAFTVPSGARTWLISSKPAARAAPNRPAVPAANPPN